MRRQHGVEMSLDSVERSVATGSAAARTASAAERVLRYYGSTWFDYRAIWMNPTTRAMHLGVWGRDARSHPESLLAANRIVAEAASVDANTSVLDAGCGVGGLGMWLAENYSATVLGISIVADQVARAERYVRERGVDPARARFEVRDYHDTGLPGQSFDVVIAQESACHSPAKAEFFKEASRLLKPGGKLVLVDYVATGRFPSPRQQALLDNWTRGWAIEPITDLHGWVEPARQSGLGLDHVVDLSPRSRRSSRRLYWLCTLLQPLSSSLRFAGLRDDTAHRNLIASRDQWLTLKQGLWSHLLLCFEKREA